MHQPCEVQYMAQRRLQRRAEAHLYFR